jgi:DNA adenine methylase
MFDGMRIRPAIKRYGGKYPVVSRIIKRWRQHDIYVEPFVGGGSVLLSKRPARIEAANDKDAELMHFYVTLRDRTAELRAALDPLSSDLETFNWALELNPSCDPVLRAVRFFVLNHLSFSGHGEHFGRSDRLRRGMPEYESAWKSAKENLLWVAARLALVELRNQDALEVIREFDGPKTLHYLDPPYPHSTRTTPDGYLHEMSDAQHVEVLDLAVRCQGMVMISGRHCELYDEALRDWHCHPFNVANHTSSAPTKRRSVDCLWLNPACRSHWPEIQTRLAF